MGKIPEFNRRALASGYVGAPQLDTAGAAEASAAVAGLKPLLTSEMAKLKQRQDVYTDLASNTAIVDYSLAFQKEARAVEEQYADNPSEYPGKIVEMGNQLANTYADKIQDDITRSKFLKASGAMMRQVVPVASKWAVDKQKNNAALDVATTANTISKSAGQTLTIDGLMQNLGALKETIYELPQGEISTEIKDELYSKHAPEAVEAHLYNRVYENPEALIESLDNGEYNDLTEFTDEMKVSFKSSAETRIRTLKKEKREAQRDNFQGATLALLADELTFEGVDDLANAEDPYQQISPAEANQLKKALVRQIRTDATLIGRNNEAAFKYLDLINKFVDDGIDRAKFQSSVVDVFADGVISKEESTYLGELKSDLTNAKVAADRNAVSWNLQKTKDVVGRLLGANSSELVTTQASAVQAVLSLAIKSAVPIGQAADSVINAVKKQIVTDKDPLLAGTEDPVEESYHNEAVNLLTTSGERVTDANVKAVIERLKRAER